eukprot:gene9124-10097_t
MEGKNLSLVLQENTWLPKKEKTSSTLAQEGIVIERTLGEGAYGKVKSAYYEKIKKRVAVKIINKMKVAKDFMEKFLKREIAMMSELDHPNIIQLLAIFESEDKIFLIMELADGGDLLDHVNNQKYASEDEIRKHFLQLASAMSYSHQMGVVHRDLKLENIVMDKNSNVKITDFGFARRTVIGSKMETFCGSFEYACPTILRAEMYDGFAADVWSMGVMLYTMFTYRLPYTDTDLKILAKGSGMKKLKFSKDTPQSARDLIRRMLDPKDETRITCQQILSHGWLRGESSSIYQKANEDAIPSIISATTTTPQQVENETSSISMGGDDPEDDVMEMERDNDPDKQFHLISARRSTITSTSNQKFLSNIVQPKRSNFAKIVKKKRVALLTLGGFGKRKKDKIAEESSEVSDKVTRKASKKSDNLTDIVAQVVKAKESKQLQKNCGEFLENIASDDDIEQMRKELISIRQEDSSNIITNKSEMVNRKESLVNEPKQTAGKISKWKKVCSKMNK